MRYKLVIFDLDGTLIDSDLMIIHTLESLYKDYRPDYHPSLEHMLAFSGPQITETLPREFPGGDMDLLLKEFQKRSVKFYEQDVKLYPGIDEIVEALIKKNVFYGIFTNKLRNATEFALKLVNISDVFPSLVCADDVPRFKPYPDGVFKMMEMFNITDPKDVLYIGDGQNDYNTAKNAGVDFCFTKWSPRKLEEGCVPNLEIESFSQFAKDVLNEKI